MAREPYVYYQVLTEPVKPTPPAPITINHWHVERLPYIIPPQPPDRALAQSQFDLRGGVFPIPYPGGPVTIDNWFVDQYPWIPAPPTRTIADETPAIFAEDPGPFPPAAVRLAAFQLDDVALKVRVHLMGRYGVVSVDTTAPISTIVVPGTIVTHSDTNDPWPFITRVYAPKLSTAAWNTLGGLFKGLLTEKLFPDKWLPSGLFPYPKPQVRAISEYAGPIFPIPFVPATGQLAGFYQEYPYAVHNSYYFKNEIAAIRSLAEAQVFIPFILPITSFWWQAEVMNPNCYTAYNAAIGTVVREVGPLFPIVATVPTFTLASFFTEWFPQPQQPTRLPALIALQNFTRPTFPQPFVSAVITGLPWWQQETYQNFLAGRYDYLKSFPGQVAPVFPIQAPPPPVVICPNMPSGFDVDTRDSIFIDKTGKPVAVLLCRICHSGLPLLVRGDFAIWCQTCCAFVSREDTVMSTTRAPKFFKGVF